MMAFHPVIPLFSRLKSLFHSLNGNTFVLAGPFEPNCQGDSRLDGVDLFVEVVCPENEIIIESLDDIPFLEFSGQLRELRDLFH